MVPYSDNPPGDDERPQTPTTNGHIVEDNGGDGEPPSKRRRVSETASNPRKKLESPPWKRIEAEGPSSFTQDGMRKSGRTNHIPLELQPPSDKRTTRGAVQKTTSAKVKHGTTNGNGPQLRGASSKSVNGVKKAVPSGSPSNHVTSKSPSKSQSSPKRLQRKSMPAEQVSTPTRPYKKPAVPKSPQSAPVHAQPSKARRSGRPSEMDRDGDTGRVHTVKIDAPHDDSPRTKLARIKFRVKPASLPFTHPGLVIQRPKQYPSLKDYLEAASNIPVEEGGLLGSDDVPEYTSEAVAEDAQAILRLEKAAKQGGPLSFGVCSLYQPEEQVEPPPQYSHLDHMNRAAIEFRKLMFIEQRKHRTTAKRLAEACRDEWYRKQPKTAEQLEAELVKVAEGRYKSVVKTLQATWENVKSEVNRRRLLEWEAQEQARVRKALNEAVDLSTQKLEARRVQIDSEAPSDEDDSDISDNDKGSGSESEERESNMSSDSEAEEDQPKVDAAEDESLTVEQLREKYSTLPSLANVPSNKDAVEEDGEREPRPVGLEDTFDDSDESVDMDDDMGSSDGERDSDEVDEDDEEEEEEEEEEEDGEGDDAEESTLLGFLPKAELKSMEIDTAHDDLTGPTEEDVDMEDHDEVSLVPDRVEGDQSETGNLEPLGAPSGRIDTISESSPQVPEVTTASPDRSSQPTPRTTDTRTSEIDSVSSVDAHQTSRQVSQSITPQPTSKTRTAIPFLLRGTLREYQHDGLDWLAGQYAANTNGILADEMGLGKTIQTIALLAHLACEHQVWGPHLVIVPTSVMLNWEMEFKKWCPGFKILTYYGTQEERKRKRLGWKSEDAWNVCITSYQLVIQDQQVFKRRRWHYMILDEAHNIKNFQSQRWQTMLTFNTRARLLLTGTPLQNNLTELWSLLYFLAPPDMAASDGKPGGFTNLKDFQDWFKKPSDQILEHGRDQMDDESRAIIAKLHQVLRPYLLRRLKADVEKQMPGKYEHVEFCRLSKRQRELYDSFLSREDTRGTLASGNYLSIINCLMQLRKVCNHPDLFLDRPIMTSFPMEKSAITDFEIKELLLRRRLLSDHPMTKVSLNFLNLVPADHEVLSDAVTARSTMLSAQRKLMDLREAQRSRAQNALTNLDPSTAKSNLVYLESASRWGRFEELQHCVYLNALRRQQKPIYGTQLVELLTIGINDRPLKPQPKRRDRMLTWLHNRSPALTAMVPTITSRSLELQSTIQKFACVTPPVIARDMTSLVMTPKGVNTFRGAVRDSKTDPFHEARMRLSIQFPDKRLLQYDCGKLQTLAKLLRKLQAGGHRALIFTQMTKVLDILEQFLNIHGHKYLRLDGSTKIEQRQILTDRFNNDTRILAFILSSRSGGLGINLTGADTVIFYDLDWNPAMDKQCQDRCHRIGQTRDVHIYRLVSEHTIEANILRKANQKRMLDDVVIQEGEFTTDYFNKMSVRDVLGEESELRDGDAAANAAMDRVLGGPDSTKDVSRVLAQAEDVEDVAAAKVAAHEIVQTDAADFDENAITMSATPAGPGTPRDGEPTAEGTPALDDALKVDEEEENNAWGEMIESTDEYMLKFMAEQLKDTPVELPKDKNRSKRGKDHRIRSQRIR
ncbi:Helicase SWR1 [Hyphodiscus hymeniophilus]|uniref:DNA helicase n=1 Tax=Hyphodiscus hymeniophilus TaxID=353542 RepID=A0A9P7AZD0_9HELO|nr:Helicase SWR1 [Hyphodiscus hymeniophilus]